MGFWNARQSLFRTWETTLGPRVLAEIQTQRRWPDYHFTGLISSLADDVARGLSPTHPDLLAKVFAACFEALRRTRNIELYPVQFQGGLSLCQRSVAELQTGEGKTFTAILPTVLWALHDRGVHIATSNAYLAKRDGQLLTPALELLGLSTGILCANATAADRQAAYNAHITYGAGYEFGFDYLRDQLSLHPRQNRQRLGQRVLESLTDRLPAGRKTLQRGLFFSLVDEADHVLLDEATSPLILSNSTGKESGEAEVVQQAHRVAGGLVERVDFSVELSPQSITLKAEGVQKIFELLPAALRSRLYRPWNEYIQQAIHARRLLQRDIDYVVQEEGIRLIDQATGRIFADRTWRDGLQQAIECKEGIAISAEQHSAATISRQEFHLRYAHLAGLSGTASESRHEFREIFGLNVVSIPLHRPSRRVEHPALGFASLEQKWEAIAADVAARRAKGQPVLVGTRTVADSVALAERIDQLGVAFQVLNGMQDGHEATLIGQAGQAGRVTIATNVAGRGTDIRPSQEAIENGGLHVVVSEPHGCSRVDRQLMGRAGRQGEPGSTQRFFSADDVLLRDRASWLADWLRRSARRSATLNANTVPASFVRAVQKVQHDIEAEMFQRRRHVWQATRNRNELLEGERVETRFAWN